MNDLQHMTELERTMNNVIFEYGELATVSEDIIYYGFTLKQHSIIRIAECKPPNFLFSPLENDSPWLYVKIEGTDDNHVYILQSDLRKI